MAQVRIRDTSLWTKHIVGAPELKEKLEALRAGEKVWLRVDGRRGCFEKMKGGPNGPMQGFKPVDGTRELWRQLYPSRAGQLVELGLDEALPAAPSPPMTSSTTVAQGPVATSDAEREAAWNAFKVLTKAGWRSDGAGGSRDDLHER